MVHAELLSIFIVCLHTKFHSLVPMGH